MPSIHRLKPLDVTNAKKGRLPDGGGLYLQVTGSGSKSWLFRYTQHGKAHWIGLGAFEVRSLAEAREKAAEQRKILADSRDPLAVRRDQKAAAKLEAARSKTFKECAAEYLETHTHDWKNAKHRAQWASTLETYAYPIIGETPVQLVDTEGVLRILRPIWTRKWETARRLRSRIELVMGSAIALGVYPGLNPARWRDNLKPLLGSRPKALRVQHHPALPHAELPAFLAALRARDCVSGWALEFLILTATRTGEVLDARWREFDLNARVWIIPAARMKAGREHRVPLSDPAIAILRRLREFSTGEFVFPGSKASKPLSNMSLLGLLKRMHRADITVHGFRSTFRDWAAEKTSVASAVVEHALAHSLLNRVEAAYFRSDLFEDRRALMAQWASYCEPPAARAAVRLVA